MPENPSVEELRERLDGFVRYRMEHLTGDEKEEARLFLENLFRALGHEGLRQAGATLEMRVARTDNRGTSYADLVWKPRRPGPGGIGNATRTSSRLEAPPPLV